MDYLEFLEPQWYPDFPDVKAAYDGWDFAIVETGASKNYTQIPFQRRLLLIFGSETTGLPSSVMQTYQQRCYSIPMVPDRRSLNLSSSVAIVVYEGLKQLNGWT